MKYRHAIIIYHIEHRYFHAYLLVKFQLITRLIMMQIGRLCHHAGLRKCQFCCIITFARSEYHHHNHTATMLIICTVQLHMNFSCVVRSISVCGYNVQGHWQGSSSALPTSLNIVDMHTYWSCKCTLKGEYWMVRACMMNAFCTIVLQVLVVYHGLLLYCIVEEIFVSSCFT